MYLSAGKRFAVGAMIILGGFNAEAAQANDFFSALFGAITGQPPAVESRSSAPLPFADVGESVRPRPRVHVARPTHSGGQQAFCVRTCDGRYFPITASDNQSRAASCNSFCPASETKVFYGSTIDHAASERGKAYSELPNAFRYRKEIVASCTCNGKDHFGLAKIDVENDPTIHKGDIVAGSDGLVVAGRSADRRGASLDFSPASTTLKSRLEGVPVLASN